MARTSANVSSMRRSVKKQRKVAMTRSKAKKKYTSRAGTVTALSRNNFGFPDRFQTKLKYGDVIQLTAGAGTVALWQFRLTSLYDPDFTGTGHQPQWFDQIAGVYWKYRVRGAKITATFIPSNINDIEANDKGPYLVGITTNQGNTFGSANYPALIEDSNSNHTIIVDKQGGNNMKTLTHTFSPMRDLGISPDDMAFNLVNSDPSISNLYYATVWGVDMSEAASQDITVKIEIEYQAEFINQRVNTIS